MNAKAFRELVDIINIDSLEERELSLQNWMSSWIVEVEVSQPIIKSNLTSEDEDFIKYFMAYQLGDKLMNDCISVDAEPRRITTKVYAIKRKKS